MIKSFFKIAWRNIARSKGYSTLNILGLAIGMAVALLIGLWVYNEYSYNKFLPDYDRIYSVKRNFNSNGDTLTFSTVSLKLAEALRTQVPEIEYVVESDWMGEHGLKVDEKKLFLRGARSGSDFLKVFQYPLVHGNAASALSDPFSIVLTESTARSLFGEQDPMNKMVRFDNENDLKVTGILKDFPANSTFQIQYIVPFSYMEQVNPRLKQQRVESYGMNSFQIFVKLRPGTTLQQTAPKIRLIEHTETDNYNAMGSFVFLYPMKNWRLYSEFENGQVTGGFIKYVRMFTVIGIMILLIACINFINLTTARSEKRAREVGVRKVIGSRRYQLIGQFLAESFLLTVISFMLSLALVQLTLPAFNSLTNNDIKIPFGNFIFWIVLLGSLVVTALLAGVRPAFYLSSFRPIKVLKGRLQTGWSSSLFRKMLVVMQFTCSVVLIISTLIVYQQIQYAKKRPTGFDANRVLANYTNADINRNYTALKNELLQKGIASAVTVASSPATGIYWHSDVEQWPGKHAGETVEMGIVITGEDYFKTLGMTMKEGRDFTGENDTLSVVFNETAIKRMRLENPVGQTINWQGNQLTIVGVVNDALMISPFTPADPTLFLCNKRNKGNLMYRLAPGIETSNAIEQLTAVFNKYNPAFPYMYRFVDEDYAYKFNIELLIGKLSYLFAALAIFISCLGLFGLAAYVAEQRTKEVGIRKVLGASVSQVWILLSKDFIVLVLISCVIASPLAFWLMSDWLQQYDYRINISVWVFVLAGLMAILIALITVSTQAIKAALANPVKSLRTE